MIRQSPNGLLDSLPAKDYALLLGHLRPIDLLCGQVLIEAGRPLQRVYFPHQGVISSMISVGQGDLVEVAMIGRDGVFGASALFGELSLTSAMMRYPGRASVIDVGHFRAAADSSPALRAALMQHLSTQIMQAEQIAACNASHGVEARLCRRLLQLRELSRSGRMTLTQEAMAQMLAVQRNTISLVAHALRRAGVIRYSRGDLEITDLAGLIRRSCECSMADHISHDLVCNDPQPRRHSRFDDGLAQRSPS
ncbi:MULTISPECIES: Crp/Fnr family transcriptional regulator [Rhodopseudomonas]|nr:MULTISPECIES: Crp/Fnr family transcriptional regulator [Rhodopseudomonas]MDF3814114.1 Crp/Fnr family transcriptional regulator [Rhodopseudomonas sp. BAL398]WOK19622.1 Crp/Fnr family transcriptional regulator [Rhodopseudomonas sp. BAL398]